MRISKITWLILGLGVLIIAFIGLYYVYQNSTKERDVLLQTIENLQRQSAKLSNDKRPLDPQLAQLEDKLITLKAAFNRAKGEFPDVSIQSIEYDEELSGLAEGSGVLVTKLTATDGTAQKDGNLTYVATNFEVDVQGDMTNLLDFIHRIATSRYFSSGSMNSLELKKDLEAPAASPTPTPLPNQPTLHIALTVYRYEGN
jgi:hypothetical protein